MAKIETLTAYKCRFCYLQRNNPLFEEQREEIKAKKTPEYSFSDFIIAYQNYTKEMAIGENTDRAIFLPSNKIFDKARDGLKTWHLVPSAGKQGEPVTVFEKITGEKHKYGPDSAALYEYHIFVYENGGDIYAIFHRANGSGCKSVFLETANKAIKPKGLKLEMDLIVPLIDNVCNATASKITLQFTKQIISSDVADNINGSKRKMIIRELGLNLEASENRKIKNIFHKMQTKQIDQVQAFAMIKAEFSDAEEFNDAEVKMKMGSRYKSVKWNDFEKIMGVHDISKSLHEAVKKSKDYIGELTKLADDYYNNIIESEEV